jgi:hypothetical protein
VPEQLSFRGTLNSSGSVKKNWSPVSIKTEVLNFTLYEVTAPLVKSAGVIEIESSRLIIDIVTAISFPPASIM